MLKFFFRQLPMVLKVPRLNYSPLVLCDRPFSLLGFGDILVPGKVTSSFRFFVLIVFIDFITITTMHFSCPKVCSQRTVTDLTFSCKRLESISWPALLVRHTSYCDTFHKCDPVTDVLQIPVFTFHRHFTSIICILNGEI